MPGLFSTIFDETDSDGGRETQTSDHSADAGTDLHLDPSITIESHMGGTYETPDGTTHSWERTDSVTLETDTQIVTHVSATVSDMTVDEG
ncbi:hypothetical protein JW805_12290 [Roseomonas aeriglobus]|nr:hypothetical protein [Roseomonas aeriglobus]